MSLVLLVEDDPDHAELVAHCLRGHELPIELKHLTSGEALHEYLLNDGPPEEPSLILMDNRMPGADGFELARQLKSDSRWSHIPIVMLTTSDSPAEIAEAYKSRVNSFLVKPMELQDLYRLLHTTVLYWLAFNRLPKVGLD